jgi:type VI secretion system protein ImpJ
MKPYWPRTLPLLPVHLQARDAYVERLLALRTEQSIPDAYGFTDLSIDEAGLARGEIVLRGFEAILPSGLVVAGDKSAPLARVAADLGAIGAAETVVYLAVPTTITRGPNVSDAADATKSVRYVVGGREGDAPWIHARAEVVFGHEPRERFECIFVGRLQRIGGALRFERDSLPTVLCVRASAALTAGLRTLVRALDRRREELLRYRSTHPLNLKVVAASELPMLQLMATVQRHLPLLEEIASRRAAHPHELYRALASLYGALAPFGATETPPRYEHDDLGKVFPWLFERIERLVDEAARDRTTVLRFQRVDGATFRLSFERSDLVGKRPFLVASGVDEAILRERVPSVLKMASPVGLAPLLNSALRGVAVAVEFEPPAVIPRRRDVVAYRIDVRDPLWLDVEDRLQIQLHVLDAPQALEFALYGVERSL